MGYLRFWRRMKIAPGLTLNLSKSGGSLSFGPRMDLEPTDNGRGRGPCGAVPARTPPALVEARQAAEEWGQAYECLQRLRKLEPEDVVILLSPVELLWQANRGNEDTCRHIVKLTRDIDNATPIHTALLLYKARALNGLNMHAVARDILTNTLRRKKDRSEHLMLALRYERARTYESLLGGIPVRRNGGSLQSHRRAGDRSMLTGRSFQ
jgi:hypothetical protein